MEHISLNGENYRCEVFSCGASESEMLSAILAWWEKEHPKYAVANLDNISITWDEDGCYAKVIWRWITKKKRDAIITALTEEKPFGVDEKRLSSN